ALGLPWAVAQGAPAPGLCPPPALSPSTPPLAGLVRRQGPPGPPAGPGRRRPDLPGIRPGAGGGRRAAQPAPAAARPARAAGRAGGRRRSAAVPGTQPRGPARLRRPARAPAATGQPQGLRASGRGALLLQPHRQRPLPAAVERRPTIATGPEPRRPRPAPVRNRHRRRPGAPPARPLHGPPPGLRPAAARTARP